MVNITNLIIKDKDMEIDKLKQRIAELEQENKELYNSYMNKITKVWRLKK